MTVMDMREYRWSPDAKFIKRSDGNAVAVNFANSTKRVFGPAESSAISAFSGLTIPFVLEDSVSESLRAALIDGGFLVPEEDFAARDRMIRDAVRTIAEESSGLIIMPTEKCNFRCTYCYESFAKGRMRPERVDALAKVIETRIARARSFSLGFFGGEPLLCSDIILRLCGEAMAQCGRKGIFFGASMSTNAALLTPDLFEQLIRVGLVFFQVTLDGDRELHDRQRVTVKGKGTFDGIVAHLRAMAATSHEFTVALRCNVHVEDSERVLALFDSEELAFVRNDPRFMIDIHYIWASDRQTLAETSKEGCLSGLQAGLDKYALNAELSRRGLSTSSYDDVPGILGSACYAGKKNWFIVGADLKLYKCTVVFDNPKNNVGYIDLSGNMVIDQRLNRLWTGSNAETDSGCGSCYLRVPCGGLACPLTRFTSGSKGCLELRDAGNLRNWAERLSPPAAEQTDPLAIH
ncbi:radical SAM protein [Peteryoungia ipomoeae]|nr:radical SAM protein [Peteryoungia ipomoeae]